MPNIIWRSSKIFIDESWCVVKDKGEVLLIGGLFIPPGDPLESELEDARNSIGCIDTLHSSHLSGKKQMYLAEAFQKAFMNSSAKFRVVILPKLKEEFQKYCKNERWRMVVKGIKIMLLNSYISNTDKVKLIRPKLIIEKSDEYDKNLYRIISELISSLSVNEIFYDEQINRIKPQPIVSLVDKKVFESLQLTDLLLSLVKWDIVSPENDKKRMWEGAKAILKIKEPKKASNFSTKDKYNVFSFRGSEAIIN